MHHDGTEHQWMRREVLEQGDWLVVETYCDTCSLDAKDLLADDDDVFDLMDREDTACTCHDCGG